MNKEKFDVIERPKHYALEEVKITLEPIQLCEQCGFLVGNGLKYLSVTSIKAILCRI